MAAHENAHGVRDRGRKGTTDQESELSRTHGINDAAGSAATTPSFEAAAEYRRFRLDLIPLRRHDKMPADKRWQERTYDHAEVMERARRDGLNLGVRLPADVVVVDVDPRNFPAGRDSLAELAAAFGLGKRFRAWKADRCAHPTNDAVLPSCTKKGHRDGGPFFSCACALKRADGGLDGQAAARRDSAA